MNKTIAEIKAEIEKFIEDREKYAPRNINFKAHDDHVKYYKQRKMYSCKCYKVIGKTCDLCQSKGPHDGY